jgi:hypothetical protein
MEMDPVCDVSKKRKTLEHYAKERLARIAAGHIDDDSHLEGIANKASRLLESLLRAVVDRYSSVCEIGHAELSEISGGKPLERMTLGDFVNCLRTFNERLTRRPPPSGGLQRGVGGTSVARSTRAGASR